MQSTTLAGLQVTSQPHHIGIVGVSSALGTELAQGLLAHENTCITGYYRSEASERIELLRGRFEDRRLRLRHWSAERSDYERISQEIVTAAKDASVSTLIYCCGRWTCGPAHEVTREEIRAVTEVGLIAPMALVATALKVARAHSTDIRIVLVSGLGGERTAGANVGLYSAVTSGLYAYVRSVGEEIAGSDTCCMAVALGLMDKGQSYIDKVCAQLPIARPQSISSVASMLEQLILSADLRMYNGSVLELAGGLTGYRQLAALLTAVKSDALAGATEGQA